MITYLFFSTYKSVIKKKIENIFDCYKHLNLVEVIRDVFEIL